MTVSLPHLDRRGYHLQLIVDDQPYLAIGGELHNSTSSDPRYFGPRLAALSDAGVGTVIATVSWDQIEPVEGGFDLGILDQLLAAARDNSVRLVLIWFGAFKNATSTYAPSWVRADRQRFPRATVRPGLKTAFTYDGATPKPVLSVFSPDLRAADRTAYLALLQHLRDHDQQHTVIMIQIENETGLLGDSRDRSPLADAAWEGQVPGALLAALKSGAVGRRPAELADGTWEEVLGNDTAAHEIFMAWAFASYVGSLATAGKQILPLPIFANAWLGPQPGQEQPGQYPSGGPTARMRSVWAQAAPDVDFFAPDIYIDDVAPVLAAYTAADNPLFVPEAKLSTGNMFLAIGGHAALGYCAFGIEEARPDSQFVTALRLLSAAVDDITAAQADDRIYAVLLDDGIDDVALEISELQVTARHSTRLFRRMLLDAGVVLPVHTKEPVNERIAGSYRFEPSDDRPFAIIIELPTSELLLIGQGLSLDFRLAGDGDVEIDRVVEQLEKDGHLVDGRLLNGDERLNILPVDAVGAARLRLIRYTTG